MKRVAPKRTQTALAQASTAAIGWLAGVSPGARSRLWRGTVVVLLGSAFALSVREDAVAVVRPRTVKGDAEADSLAARFAQHRQLLAAFARFGVSEKRTAPVIAAVEREARRFGIDPLLVAAVIAHENPDLNPSSVSSAGALGIMQVMPQWMPSFRARCGGDDLTNVDINICYGVNVLQVHIDDARGSVPRGLLAYVGCVTDIPCRRYPDSVMRRWRDNGVVSD